jgi:hypothetical protein
MSGSGAGFFNRFPPWGGGSFSLGEGGGVVAANKAVVSEAPVGAAITPSAVPMGGGGPADTSRSRTMATMSLPTTAGTTPGAVI